MKDFYFFLFLISCRNLLPWGIGWMYPSSPTCPLSIWAWICSDIRFPEMIEVIRPSPSPWRAGPKHSGRRIKSRITKLAFSSTDSPKMLDHFLWICVKWNLLFLSERNCVSKNSFFMNLCKIYINKTCSFVSLEMYFVLGHISNYFFKCRFWY